MREVRFVCGDEVTEWVPIHERNRIEVLFCEMQFWADFTGETVKREERFKS